MITRSNYRSSVTPVRPAAAVLHLSRVLQPQISTPWQLVPLMGHSYQSYKTISPQPSEAEVCSMMGTAASNTSESLAFQQRSLHAIRGFFSMRVSRCPCFNAHFLSHFLAAPSMKLSNTQGFRFVRTCSQLGIASLVFVNLSFVLEKTAVSWECGLSLKAGSGLHHRSQTLVGLRRWCGLSCSWAL